MNSNFDIKKETVETLINIYKMQIPDFQRKFVWNESKKKELIESLIRNYPIGSLTLYNDKDDKTYLLVDGLQRYNTMYAYLRKPSEILNFNEYYSAANANKEISIFCKENNLLESKVKKSIKSWYEALETKKDEKYFAFENMKNLLENLKSFDVLYSDIENFQNLRSMLLKILDIRNKTVALIIYEGDKNDLPDLFTKINKKNVSLTPYEILHSMWYNYTMPCVYNDFDYKKEFEESIKEENSFDTSRNIDRFNVYMYFVALGYLAAKKLSEKYPDDKIFIKKNILDRFSKEIIFDAFSTIEIKQSNKISTVIDSLCKDKNQDEYALNIYEKGNKLLKCIDDLNKFIVDNKIDFITSKYFYLYLIYILYNSNNLTDKLPFNLEFLKSINKCTWFKDKFRQVYFFNSRIDDYYKFISNNENNFSYNDDENTIVYYCFDKNNLNQLNELKINKN